MKKPRQSPGNARFTRKTLGQLSKDGLIELLLRQQEQAEELRAQVALLTKQNAEVTNQNALLSEQNTVLTARVEELERRLGMNSGNSSRPPSSDGPEVARPKRKLKCTGFVTVFRVFGSCSQEAAKALLGFFSGILVSDRFGAYNFYEGLLGASFASLHRFQRAFRQGRTDRL